MTACPQAINLSRGTAFDDRLEMREDKEAIFNTPATDRRIILWIQLQSGDVIRMV